MHHTTTMAVDSSMGADAFEALLQRIQREHEIQRVTDDATRADFASGGNSVLLLTENPKICPEAWDLAVVLPEVLKGFAGRVRAGVAAPPESAAIAQRFGVTRFPALLFQRDGDYVGVLEGMRDWASFAPAIERMLAQPASRPPTVGIPVTAANAGTCH